MNERMKEALQSVLLTAVADSDGRLVLSGRNREMLSGRGLTRRDINAVVGDLVYHGQLRIETEGGELALTLPGHQVGGAKSTTK